MLLRVARLAVEFSFLACFLRVGCRTVYLHESRKRGIHSAKVERRATRATVRTRKTDQAPARRVRTAYSHRSVTAKLCHVSVAEVELLARTRNLVTRMEATAFSPRFLLPEDPLQTPVMKFPLATSRIQVIGSPLQMSPGVGT